MGLGSEKERKGGSGHAYLTGCGSMVVEQGWGWGGCNHSGPASIALSPSSTCGNGCGECCLNLAESVLDRNESSPIERVESTRVLLPLESIPGRDSGTGGVGTTPDAALTKNREDIDISLVIENLEYR